MIRRVRATIEQYQMLAGGETVVVAVSGGADSTALLHLLRSLRERCRLTLHICHVNHQLRPTAKAEAEAVAALARKLRLPITIKTVRVKKQASLEEAARDARYEALQKTADEIGAHKIALGHTADDQVETILLNLLRGTGPEGLAGMPAVRGRIIRPLIELRRNETRACCKRHRLPFSEDESNLDPRFLRNRVRLELLPLLRQYQPRIDEGLLRLGKILREEDALLDELAVHRLEKALREPRKGALTLDANELLKPPLALSRRSVRLALERLLGDLESIEFAHVAQVLDIAQGRVGRWYLLPRGLRVKKGYGELSFTRGAGTACCAPTSAPNEIADSVGAQHAAPVFRLPGTLSVPALGAWIEATEAHPKRIPTRHSPNIAYLSRATLGDTVTVRTWRPGDRFQPLGMDKPMKLQDFFVNEKVPREDRRSIPLVIAADGEIAWVAGHRIGERFKLAPGQAAWRLHLRMTGHAATSVLKSRPSPAPPSRRQVPG